MPSPRDPACAKIFPMNTHASVTTPDALTPPLRLPEGLAYECTQCGRSCGEFWEIPVDPVAAERIRALPAAPLAQARDPRDPVIESPWTPGQSVMRLEGGRCCMQQPDGRCSIHAAFGLAAKPNICQSFPYRFVETPGGVFVGLSFACSAVLANQGPAVATQRAELEALYRFTHSRRAASEFQLAADLPLSWEQYAAIEQDLADLLAPEVGPLAQRLVAQAVYLRLLATFLRQARTQADALLAGPEANEEALAVFHRQMRGTPAQPWPLPRKLSARRRASPLLRRMFLGFAHELRNTSGRRRGRLHAYLMLADTYLRQATGRGVLKLPGLSRPVPWRELAAVPFAPERPECDELLTRYFRHTLHRKDLVIKENIQFAHYMQLMHWGLIHWYSAAVAAEQGAGRVELEHLRDGLRNVEKFFVFHTTLDRLFSNLPILRGFMELVFARPLYAHSMGYGEWLGGSGAAAK